MQMAHALGALMAIYSSLVACAIGALAAPTGGAKGRTSLLQTHANLVGFLSGAAPGRTEREDQQDDVDFDRNACRGFCLRAGGASDHIGMAA